jgi:hypothetical protein
MSQEFSDGIQNLSPLSCPDRSGSPEWEHEPVPRCHDNVATTYLRDDAFKQLRLGISERIRMAIELERGRTGQESLRPDQIETIVGNEFIFGVAARVAPANLCALLRREELAALIPLAHRSSSPVPSCCR